MKSKLFVQHYQPEIHFLESKHSVGARICTDVCCVVDARDGFQILASRGFSTDEPADFPSAAGMTADERILFCSALETGRRFYLCIRKKPWLIFTDWQKSTGLLLILSPKSEPLATREALMQFNRQRFLFPQTVRECKPMPQTAAWQDAFDILADTFALLDNLTDPALTDSRSILSSIALLSGCRLEMREFEQLFNFNVTCLRTPNTLSFLFCTFLHLRRQSKELSMQCETNCPLPCRFTLQLLPFSAEEAKPPKFASHTSFRNCKIRYNDNTATVQISMPTGTAVFGATAHTSTEAIAFSIAIAS